MAPIISGIVMNGPTPIMSIMFSVVALPRPMPRTRCGCWMAEFVGLVAMKSPERSEGPAVPVRRSGPQQKQTLRCAQDFNACKCKLPSACARRGHDAVHAQVLDHLAVFVGAMDDRVRRHVQAGTFELQELDLLEGVLGCQHLRGAMASRERIFKELNDLGLRF